MTDTRNVFRNKPQFETNQSLQNNITPDVPEFNSNSMDTKGFAPLDNCAGGCNCNHGSNHKEHSEHECCCKNKSQENHKHK